MNQRCSGWDIPYINNFYAPYTSVKCEQGIPAAVEQIERRGTFYQESITRDSPIVFPSRLLRLSAAWAEQNPSAGWHHRPRVWGEHPRKDCLNWDRPLASIFPLSGEHTPRTRPWPPRILTSGRNSSATSSKIPHSEPANRCPCIRTRKPLRLDYASTQLESIG